MLFCSFLFSSIILLLLLLQFCFGTHYAALTDLEHMDVHLHLQGVYNPAWLCSFLVCIMYVYMHTHMPQHVCGGQRIISCQFWVLGTELSLYQLSHLTAWLYLNNN